MILAPRGASAKGAAPVGLEVIGDELQGFEREDHHCGNRDDECAESDACCGVDHGIHTQNNTLAPIRTQVKNSAPRGAATLCERSGQNRYSA